MTDIEFRGWAPLAFRVLGSGCRPRLKSFRILVLGWGSGVALSGWRQQLEGCPLGRLAKRRRWNHEMQLPTTRRVAMRRILLP